MTLTCFLNHQKIQHACHSSVSRNAMTLTCQTSFHLHFFFKARLQVRTLLLRQLQTKAGDVRGCLCVAPKQILLTLVS
jgi:hypothetical protein